MPVSRPTYIHGDGKTQVPPNGWATNFESSRPYWSQMPGAVQVSVAKNISFVRDRFINLGSVALGIGNDDDAHVGKLGLGVDTINVTGCVFKQITAVRW